MALTLLVVSLGFGVAALRGDTTVHALIPLVMPLIPLWAVASQYASTSSFATPAEA